MSSLILSGWAQPADALKVVAEDSLTFDYSAYASPEASFAGLETFQSVERVIAWSLGGQLAMRAIAAGVLRPKQLVLLAAPIQLVSGAHVKGMDPLTFAQFRENYATNPARTKTRFHALVAKGDSRMSEVLAQLGHHPQVEDTARWLPWLDALSQVSMPQEDIKKLPPTLIIHGTGDAIVPFAQSEALVSMMPQATLHRWDGVGHAPHLHDAARLRAEISAHFDTREAA